MDNTVVELVDMLYQMVSEARGIPLGVDKCIVERDRVMDILDEIKTQLPAEIEESKKLITAKNEYIASAKREAESIRKVAEEHARQMVDDQEIIRAARSRAQEVMIAADQKSKELRKVANDYAEDALKRTEEAITAALDEIRQSRSRFRSASSARSAQPLTPDDDDLDEEEI